MWTAFNDHLQRRCEIVRDFTLSDFAKAKIQISVDELLAEREAVQDLLND